jgi:hypothetical protein
MTMTRQEVENNDLIMKPNIQSILENKEQYVIGTLILELASDIAEQLTERDCEIHNIACWVEDENDEMYFTDDARDIFNIYYDKLCDELDIFTSNIVNEYNNIMKNQ